MLPADNMQAAVAAGERLAEPRPDGRPSGRARHYWDGERQLARYLAGCLNISARQSLGAEGGAGVAWDVYLVYGRGATEVERPTFWMHQLGVTHAPRLDVDKFRRRVEALLDRQPRSLR